MTAGVVRDVLERVDHDEPAGAHQITRRVHRPPEAVDPAPGRQQRGQLVLAQRVREDPVLEVRQVVVDALQRVGEGADEGRQDPRQHRRHRGVLVDRVIGMPVQCLQRGAGVPTDRDDVTARDVQVDLHHGLRIRSHAVHDDQQVAVVVGQPGPLVEVGRVPNHLLVETEQVGESTEVLDRGPFHVEPQHLTGCTRR